MVVPLSQEPVHWLAMVCHDKEKGGYVELSKHSQQTNEQEQGGNWEGLRTSSSNEEL